MNIIEIFLLIMLLICGIATCLTKNLMTSVIIFMSFSVVMSIVWGLLEAPDLAITEAAVGAGISSVLLFITLLMIQKIKDKTNEK
ncbi:MAG: DUF4040 domain-containing protein [Erysipelotrichaceae bacterium]|nr:DUF4040 domain-containing protein [Erysipelotrichaceae bacterium]